MQRVSQMYKYIIFDIDGTLIDNDYALLHSLQDTIIHTQNRNIDIDKLTFTLGITSEDALRKLGIDNIATTIETWNKYLELYQSSISLFDGITDVLASLIEMGYKLGVVTSKTRQEYIDDFVPFGISNLFEITICADDTNHHKPSPKPLLEFINLSKINTNEAIYIGDSLYDYECAKGAKVDFGVALWGGNRATRDDAKYHFHTPKQILESFSSSQ